ncbi:MAG: hypothetical protein K6T30_03915 [Alicyclobacillus sp.]|nr:hypothetical protein [Alicyclobacillus sp.]
MPPRVQGQPAAQAAGGVQPPMAEPPAIITTKDLSYLRDMMSWLLLAAKKCYHYAQECTDSTVAQVIHNIGQMHQRHYQMLLNHCQTNNPQVLASLPQGTVSVQ